MSLAEAKFTPGLTVGEVLEHGSEIAEGLLTRCTTAVVGNNVGVFCAVTDVMFLIDAYREALALIDGCSAEPPKKSRSEGDS